MSHKYEFFSIVAHESSEDSAYLSIYFDIGGCIGAIAAGYIADKSGASAITCIVMLIIAIPSVSFQYFSFIFNDVTARRSRSRSENISSERAPSVCRVSC